jgi:Uma2 family endonuclease
MAIVLDASEVAMPVEPARLPDHYEIVNGEVVEIAPMSDYARLVANRLNRELIRYLDTNEIGESCVERLFRIPLPEDRTRNRQPDMAFVSYIRWPRDQPYPYTGNARDVVPDIAAEVVSPGDTADELIAKAREYLRGGVRLVWIVYPLAQEIHAYWPGANTIRVYAAADELDAGDVLPGFHTAVAALFPPVDRPPQAANGEATPGA